MGTSWYYTQNQSEQQGPISQEDLLERIQAGQVKPTDMAWCEGMGDWQAVSRIPALSGTAAPTTTPTPPSTSTGLPEGLLSWMNFVGILSVIGGILGLCALLLGLPLLLAGLALLAARTALAVLPRIDPAMVPFLEKLRSYMKLLGIFWILYIGFYLLLMLVSLFLPVFAGLSHQAF